jgi:hypothetical protein
MVAKFWPEKYDLKDFFYGENGLNLPDFLKKKKKKKKSKLPDSYNKFQE